MASNAIHDLLEKIRDDQQNDRDNVIVYPYPIPSIQIFGTSKIPDLVLYEGEFVDPSIPVLQFPPCPTIRNSM